MRHLLNLSSDEMEALVEHREKLDAELIREWMEGFRTSTMQEL